MMLISTKLAIYLALSSLILNNIFLSCRSILNTSRVGVYTSKHGVK